jgi:hypothetical protein
MKARKFLKRRCLSPDDFLVYNQQGTVEVNGGRCRATDGTPIRRGAHASASNVNDQPVRAGRDARHLGRRSQKVERAMKNVKHVSVRVAAAVATVVALIATVGAPVKWY